MDLISLLMLGLGVAIAASALVVVSIQWDLQLGELARDIGWQRMWHERIMEDEHDDRD